VHEQWSGQNECSGKRRAWVQASLSQQRREHVAKTLRFAISLAALAGMVVSSLGLTASVSAHQASASKGTIAFLRSGPDLYYQYGLNGAEAAAARLGYKVVDFPNPTVSPAQEKANIQNAIADKVSAIDGYSVGLATETASIDAAAAANIPVFLMYGYSHAYIAKKNVVGFEQVNLQKYSFPVGQYLKSHVKGGQLAIITGQLGRGDAEGYRTGFLQGLGCTDTSGAYTKCGTIDYVDQESGGWLRPTAYAKAQDIIAKYPNLAAMFVENEDMAVGAHSALVAAHKDKQVFLVSQNGAPYGLAGIAAGWLQASDTCSPFLEGMMSVRLIDAYLGKQITGGHLYYSVTVFVTKANINQGIPWNPKPAAIAALMKLPLPKPVTPAPM
jgi:ABC-type sugar transport system substrate-binding protein